jgi:type VI secretion system protein VasJ
MLGVTAKHRWNWVAMGKHPAAKDYFRIGGRSSLIDAVAAWSAKGYDALHPAKNQSPLMHSWRFWLRGVKKGALICGLGRDSGDSIGRPYPLLIMGEGRLKGWEKRWTHLPTLLNNLWKSMESIVAGRFDDINSLEEQILSLNGPTVKLNVRNKPCLTEHNHIPDRDLAACKRSIAKNGYGTFGLNNHHTHAAPDQCAMQCHVRLKACCEKIPLGVFMGGPPQKSYVVILQRPLRTADFVRLWSL